MKNNRRDLLILKFLWEYKVATSAMIIERYFPSTKPRTAYNCLMRLKRKKLITTKVTNRGTFPVWELTKDGLKEIRNYIPSLESKVTSSENHIHDIIVTSMHLGPFIQKAPSDLKIITEQRLRCQELTTLPEEIPSPKEHRPDGYWLFNKGNQHNIFALEVELNQKAKRWYEDLAYFYGDFKKNDRCIWVVRKASTAKTILRCLYKTRPEYYIHNFVLLKDIIKKGWTAEFFLGPNQDETILEVFKQNTQYISNTLPVNVFQKYLIDNRLSYEIHSTLTDSEIKSRINSMEIFS